MGDHGPPCQSGSRNSGPPPTPGASKPADSLWHLPSAGGAVRPAHGLPLRAPQYSSRCDSSPGAAGGAKAPTSTEQRRPRDRRNTERSESHDLSPVKRRAIEESRCAPPPLAAVGLDVQRRSDAVGVQCRSLLDHGFMPRP